MAINFEARITSLAKNKNLANLNVPTLKPKADMTIYDEKLKSFFTDENRKIIRKNYSDVMRKAVIKLGYDPIPKYEIYGILAKCYGAK